jgi:hypothetical protein
LISTHDDPSCQWSNASDRKHLLLAG